MSSTSSEPMEGGAAAPVSSADTSQSQARDGRVLDGPDQLTVRLSAFLLTSLHLHSLSLHIQLSLLNDASLSDELLFITIIQLCPCPILMFRIPPTPPLLTCDSPLYHKNIKWHTPLNIMRKAKSKLLTLPVCRKEKTAKV